MLRIMYDRWVRHYYNDVYYYVPESCSSKVLRAVRESLKSIIFPSKYFLVYTKCNLLSYLPALCTQEVNSHNILFTYAAAGKTFDKRI